jgi:hypothetical protein
MPDGMEVNPLKLATASICSRSTDVGTLYLTEETFLVPRDGSVGVGSGAEVCFAAFLALPLSLGAVVPDLGTGYGVVAVNGACREGTGIILVLSVATGKKFKQHCEGLSDGRDAGEVEHSKGLYTPPSSVFGSHLYTRLLVRKGLPLYSNPNYSRDKYASYPYSIVELVIGVSENLGCKTLIGIRLDIPNSQTMVPKEHEV